MDVGIYKVNNNNTLFPLSIKVGVAFGDAMYTDNETAQPCQIRAVQGVQISDFLGKRQEIFG